MSHFRRTALVSASAALIFTASAAPAAIAADAPASASAATTDGILGLPIDLPALPVVPTLPVVGGLLGGTTAPSPTTLPTLPGLEILNTVLSSVPVIGGSDPTTALGALPPLPILPDVLAAVTGGAGGDPLSALLPALSGLTGGLPVDGLPAGTVPTGAALKPATDLLRQVAAATAGTPLAGALTSLADQIDAAGDNGVSADLLTVLASTLGSIAQTDGVPAPVQQAAGMLATQVAPKPTTTTTPPATGGTTPSKPVATTTTTAPKPTTTTTTGTAPPKAPVKLGRVAISSLKLDRAKGVVTVALRCPATGPACLTIVTAYRGSTLAGSVPLTYIASGQTVKKKLKLNSAARKALKRKTTKFKVGALLQGGKVASKSVTTKLPKKKAARK